MVTKSKLKFMARAFWKQKASNANNGARSHATSSDGYLRHSKLMQKDVVKSLRLGSKDKAFNLLYELASTGDAMKAKNFSSILSYCAVAPDPLFAKETFNLMTQKGIKLNDRCCLLVVRALCRGNNLEEAFSFLNNVRSKSNDDENDGVDITLASYNVLLKACVRSENPTYVDKCLDLMDDLCLGKNKVTYAHLLELANASKNSTLVHTIWNYYHSCYSMNVKTLRKFIHSFMRIRDLESALKTFHGMLDVVCQSSSGTNHNHDRSLSSSLDIPIPLKNDDSLSKYNRYCSNGDLNKEVKFDLESYVLRMSKTPMSKPVKDLLMASFVDVIQTCASAKNPVLAEQLISQMETLGFKPSSLVYDGLIRALSSSGNFRRGIKFLGVMQEKKLKPRSSTLASLSVSCSEAFELDMAMSYLNQMSESPFVKPFNAYLRACDSLDRPELAVRALAKMKALRVEPDITTYEHMFSLFGNVNPPYEEGNIWSQVDVDKRVRAIETDMMKHGINHSRRSLQNLLRAVGMEGMTSELEHRLADVENRHMPKMRGEETIHIYNTVLWALVENKNSPKAVEIFSKMVQCGLYLNENTYSIVVNCCDELKSYRSALSVLCMMIRHCYRANAVVYTSLIKILLYNNDFQRAMKLICQAGSEGFSPDVVMYNTVLREAGVNGRIDVIEMIVEMMRRERVKPDPSTCSYVVSAYADNGFDSTAVEALHVLSVWMISEEGDDVVLVGKRLEYEKLIFSEEIEAESSILEVFKDSPFLAIGLLNLRWCATFGIMLSWSPDDSPWVKRLVGNYDSTPRG